MNPQEHIDKAELHKLNNEFDEAMLLWKLVVDVYPETDQGRYAVEQIRKYQPLVDENKKSSPTGVSRNGQSMGFFSFEGRINRSTFWPTIITLLLITFAFYFVLTLGGASSNNQGIFSVLDLIYTILATWVLYATCVKRFHDLDKPGWLALTLLIPIVNLLTLVYLGLASGTTGINKYGEEPQL